MAVSHFYLCRMPLSTKVGTVKHEKLNGGTISKYCHISLHYCPAAIKLEPAGVKLKLVAIKLELAVVK